MTLQEVANKLETKYFSKTPVGKAQQVILDALNVEVANFGHANAFFNAIGIIVLSKREGRRSIPVVIVEDNSGGGLNLDGEGEVWNNANEYLTEDVLKKLKPWIKEISNE